ncbi:hypothetical protein CC1G_02106 [Coprinopsis cinerea okayama7|uniref:Uncharacterized protein n=1 Tax=Coprinopsis cinerea (strain Okayama-7 / 130 / ATCC MYA-4618 / FGSC 9003) TaxID=240176 RepID=A8NK75_COPC7|nr:hypothetical protein CC1G_02106 [Coprinopsis cinerea okayama7\|eukprot:XP_001834370.1 hypothetical protein CC1G_02106 [Coprinopsis cinerea okayama7\
MKLLAIFPLILVSMISPLLVNGHHQNDSKGVGQAAGHTKEAAPDSRPSWQNHSPQQEQEWAPDHHQQQEWVNDHHQPKGAVDSVRNAYDNLQFKIKRGGVKGGPKGGSKPHSGPKKPTKARGGRKSVKPKKSIVKPAFGAKDSGAQAGSVQTQGRVDDQPISARQFLDALEDYLVARQTSNSPGGRHHDRRRKSMVKPAFHASVARPGIPVSARGLDASGRLVPRPLLTLKKEFRSRHREF